MARRNHCQRLIMKAYCLLLLAVCQYAAANSYPNAASGSNLLVQSEVIRQRMAPYYGEVPSSKVQVKDIGKSVQEYSAKTILDASQSALASIPEYVTELHNERTFTATLESNIDGINTTRNIAESAGLDSTAQQPGVKNIPTFDQLTQAQRILPEPLPLDSKNIVLKLQSRNIPQIQNVDKPDVFTIRLEFDWNKPHGQWMTQLLKDIKIAKAAGDTETYTRLTKQYSAWANTYLLKGTPPRVMK